MLESLTQNLKKYIEQLATEHAALYRQLSSELDEADRVRIKRRIENLEEEYKESIAKLRGYEATTTEMMPEPSVSSVPPAPSASPASPALPACFGLPRPPRTAKPSQPLRLFLCYAHEDRHVVSLLYDQLKTDGFAPWMDKRDLLLGQRWEQEIPKAVQQADVFIICLSPHTVSKEGYVQQEMQLALDTAKKQPENAIFIIPLRLELCDVPQNFRHWQWGDLFDSDGYDQLLRTLDYCAKNPPPPTNPLFPVTLTEWRNEIERRNTIFGQPAGYWCYVRPGKYRIGGWNKDEESADIELPGFWIAKYPVTVQQYATFIKAGGYNTKQWWTPNGWEWKQAYDRGKGRTQPYYWNNHDKFNAQDNQPVVAITWYEATAFANWIQAELASILPSGSTLRLPTHAEWEAAAAYDEAMHRRTYSWGEQEPTPKRAVYKYEIEGQQNPDRPAPVGTHPDGAAACGAHDMGGNVWEWLTSGTGDYPAKSSQVVADFVSSDKVALRGGSWGRNRTYVRCLARNWIYPVYSSLYGGGRLVWFVSP